MHRLSVVLPLSRFDEGGGLNSDEEEGKAWGQRRRWCNTDALGSLGEKVGATPGPLAEERFDSGRERE